MLTIKNNIIRFVTAEDGPTAVEYAIMLALILLVCLVGIRGVGQNTLGKFNYIKNELT